MTRLTLAANLAGKAIAVILWHHTGHWTAAAFFFGPDLVLLYQLFVPSAQGLGPVVTCFQTERKEVWLTIDDGPDESDTRQILDLLDGQGAKATFFLVGERASRHPDLVAEIVRRGNEVAHHTQTHPLGGFWCASPSRVRRELDEGLRVLVHSGVRPRRFRAPAGIKNLSLHTALHEREMTLIGWSARGFDCRSRDPRRIEARIMGRVRPGAIILLHEGEGVHPAVRVRAIAGVLAALKARGFACIIPAPEQLR